MPHFGIDEKTKGGFAPMVFETIPMWVFGRIWLPQLRQAGHHLPLFRLHDGSYDRVAYFKRAEKGEVERIDDEGQHWFRLLGVIHGRGWEQLPTDSWVDWYSAADLGVMPYTDGRWNGHNSLTLVSPETAVCYKSTEWLPQIGELLSRAHRQAKAQYAVANGNEPSVEKLSVVIADAQHVPRSASCGTRAIRRDLL